MNLSLNKKIVVVSLLISIAAIWRIINHDYNLAPNLELVTTASVLAAIIIGIKASSTTALLSMAISDSVIGNSSIFIFTWSAFVLIGISASLLKKLNQNPKKQVAYSAGFAVLGSFVFFIVTNLGVWLQGWYPPTISGLTECFVAAIPFYRTMLIGNLIVVPTAVAAWQFVKVRQTANNSVIDSFVSN